MPIEKGKTLSRRDFLRRAVSVAPAIAETAVFANGFLGWLPRAFEFSEREEEDLTGLFRESAEKIAPRIYYGPGFENPFKIDGKLIQARPNSGVIAVALSFIGYFDGGLERLEWVTEKIQSRGLTIDVSDSLSVISLTQRPNWRKKDDTAVIFLHPRVVERYFREQPTPSNEDVFWRELYNTTLLPGTSWEEDFVYVMKVASWAIPAWLYLIYQGTNGYKLLAEKFRDWEAPKIARRTLPAAISIGLTALIGSIVNQPPEQQNVLFRTGIPIAEGITLPGAWSPFMDGVRGRFLLFEEIENKV